MLVADYESFLRAVSDDPSIMTPFNADIQQLIWDQVLFMEKSVCIGRDHDITYDKDTMEQVYTLAKTIGY